METDRHVTFTIRARDETGEIGSGSHKRMVIDLAKFTKRLESGPGESDPGAA
jgi:predicted thioesterase